MKKYLVIILVILFSLTYIAAEAGDLSDVQQSGKLRLGVPPEYIPFIYYDNAGNTTGIDVALAQEVARRMGVEVQVVNLAFDGLIDSLNLGQVDMIGGAFAKTDERQQQIDFSRVYYSGSPTFIALSSLQKTASSMDAFRDLRVGVQKGTSFDQWIKTNLVGGGYISARNVYTYSSAADEIRALDRGDVDLVMLDKDTYEDLYRSSGKYQVFFDNIAQEKFAFGLRKGSDLTSVVSGHLGDMIKDGTAQNIANRFFQMNFNEAKTDVTRDSSIATPTPNVPVYVIPDKAAGNTCLNGMQFVSDVTITDGHQVSQGEKFRKIWRVKNTGSCPWTTNYTFVYVSGDQMSGRNISVPSAVQPGQTVDLGVDLVAPSKDGTYRGYWQMRSPQGQNFGETIWVKIRVKGGGSGGSRVIPEIKAFYPDYYSLSADTCPRIYWQTKNAAVVELRVDGVSVAKGYTVNGSNQFCGPLQTVGTHNVELVAYSNTDTTYQSFTFTTTPSHEGQRRIVPVINYFYVDPDSGYAGASVMAYWSVSNAASVDMTIDGNMVGRTNDATGAISISSAMKSAGTHKIVLTAHSVTDDTTATAYYTVHEEGQHRVVPVIDYFYVDPTSGYAGSSATVYWSVSNAAVVDFLIDGKVVLSNGPASGSGPVYNEIRSVGTHSITLRARSVTDDVTSTIYYTTQEAEKGGWAGSNYYENEQDAWNSIVEKYKNGEITSQEELMKLIQQYQNGG